MLCSKSTALAALIHVNLGLSQQTPLRLPAENNVAPLRVAVVGGGAAGTSTAYHLAKFANLSRLSGPLEITIFDENDRFGGRTTTVNALDDPRYPIELGASIYVKVNHILYNASNEFDLVSTGKIFESTSSNYELGIWDGEQFVFKIANDDDDSPNWKSRFSNWWGIAKMLWKYGLSPIKTQRAMKSSTGAFFRMYDRSDLFPFDDLDSAVELAGLQDYTGVTGRQALENAGVSEQFSREVVQASTRVNYAQNLHTIHGLETMVCMATDGAMSVVGGNWQIFDQFGARSGAKKMLNTRITSVNRDETGIYHLSIAGSPNSLPFDTVVLAAPYHLSNITFDPPPAVEPEKVDYVKLHVALFTSPHRPSPRFFGLEDVRDVPDTILTTLPANIDLGDARGKDAVGPTDFWSISTLRTIYPDAGTDVAKESMAAHGQTNTEAVGSSGPEDRVLYLYKIFSPKPVTAQFLNGLFDLRADLDTSDQSTTRQTDSTSADADDLPISRLSRRDITWSHTRTWHSYPYLPPTTTFPPLRLDRPHMQSGDPLLMFHPDVPVQAFLDGDWPCRAEQRLETMQYHPHKENARGVWYTGGIETFISTMETSALMGRNVARLIVDGLELEAEEREDGGKL